MALNDVRGGAAAFVEHTVVSANAGDVTVRALSKATLVAHLESAVSSSGGGKFRSFLIASAKWRAPSCLPSGRFL